MSATTLPFSHTRISLGLLLCLALSGCDSTEMKSEDVGREQIARTKGICTLGEAIETDGYRRLALIVGVGEYKNDRVPDLPGPPNDASRFYDLLTGKNGYGFPKENVCLLLNEEATTARFKEVFEKALVERAREQDVAVFFYAGHGSRKRDRNGDEPDEYDETFMLHDARTGDIGDLVDDEFNGMLALLHSLPPTDPK